MLIGIWVLSLLHSQPRAYIGAQQGGASQESFVRMNKWTTLKHHMFIQIHVHRQKEARHDNLDNENTLPKILWCWKEILQKKFF